jgi:hypothetical protein
MSRWGLISCLLALLAGLAACEDRPPIDVYGHKDSIYKRLVIGIPI